MGIKFTPPEPISADHIFAEFSCGIPSLDSWLKTRALRNEKQQASRTFVICQQKKVIGYYALAAGSVEHERVPSKIKRNMPNPIPVVVLGRLAIDLKHQGQGIGKALLRDAILRTLQAADVLGIKALIVHALDETAKRFYKNCGFSESPLDQLSLMLLLEEAKAILE